MRLALIQMRCLVGEPDANLRTAGELLAPQAGRVDLACLPELVDVGYDPDGLGPVELARPIPGERTEALSRLARRLDMGLVAGLLERDPAVPEVLYDSVVLLSRSGELVGTYRKTHLHPAEHRAFRVGDRLSVFEVDGLKVGIAICFELAFPEIVFTLARRGAQLVLNPSAVPVGFEYLQELRTRARAQDNQIFVAAVNHVGREGSAVYCGSSLVADPRGEVLGAAPPDDAGAVTATLALARIRSERIQEPVFRTRRPELYDVDASR